jgi:hypothetical protein
MTRFMLALMVSCLFPLGAFAQQEAAADQPVSDVPTPVVLELFTSQACPFCPAADELMGQMIQQPGVIGLSCHVDYFEVKTSPLGKDFCTARQNEYNRLIGTGPRYTPQVVVNGAADVVGYDGGKISAAILKARSERMVLVDVAPAQTGYIVSLPETDLKDQSVRLWLVLYDKPREATIKDGGNSGKTIAYYNVVSDLVDFGVWDGAAMEKTVSPIMAANNAGFVVLAQDISTGRIIAVGSLRR